MHIESLKKKKSVLNRQSWYSPSSEIRKRNPFRKMRPKSAGSPGSWQCFGGHWWVGLNGSFVGGLFFLFFVLFCYVLFQSEPLMAQPAWPLANLVMSGWQMGPEEQFLPVQTWPIFPGPANSSPQFPWHCSSVIWTHSHWLASGYSVPSMICSNLFFNLYHHKNQTDLFLGLCKCIYNVLSQNHLICFRYCFDVSLFHSINLPFAFFQLISKDALYS